ncbi:P-loop containing nucleoside triphosphate hydrolase protein [Mycena pura]|uniref:DNA 3'-5' helicase n=1 Tax=Mycena pura TaxID=153505 RepID=A0AAD6YJE6_9AGAR|nr:P-loop containing nucleoside triphosphate hydrolase protein [Mycena pura]
MSEELPWMSPAGATALKSIVATCLPSWKAGLHPWQEEPILRILDGQDILLCTATGSGKSSLFMVPILCHQEVHKQPHLYPGLRACANPLGIVITPTKGLGRNLADSLTKSGISALAYDREALEQARNEKRSLFEEITSFTYQVVFIDPEHLDSPLWGKILDKPAVRQNIIFACLEEGHLAVEWITFRVSYGRIGKFLRGRLSSHTSVFTITATLEPGAPQSALQTLLGFRAGNFTVFRYSNERQDVQFSIIPLEHGITSRSYPQIIPILNCNRKVIVYVPSLEIATRLYCFLLRMEPPGVDHTRRVRVYTALCDSEFNMKTLELMENDPQLQVIIATVALANGVHCSTIDDSISIGMPSTLSQTEQQVGRAARAPGAIGRAIVFVQKSDIKKAKTFFAGPPNARRAKGAKAPQLMDASKAEVLIEVTCLNAARNRRYQNPPTDATGLDCIDAKRPLPCSLCALRHKIDLSNRFPPRSFTHAPFLTPPAPSKVPKPRALTVTKKERPAIENQFRAFGAQIAKTEMYSPEHEFRTRSWFFPLSLQTMLTDSILRLESRENLDLCLAAVKWHFRSENYASELWVIIQKLQASIRSERAETAAKRAEARTINGGGTRKRRGKQPDSDDDPEETDASDSDADLGEPVLAASADVIIPADESPSRPTSPLSLAVVA